MHIGALQPPNAILHETVGYSLWQMLPYAGGSAKVGGMCCFFLRVGAHSFTRQW